MTTHLYKKKNENIILLLVPIIVFVFILTLAISFKKQRQYIATVEDTMVLGEEEGLDKDYENYSK